MEYINTFNTTAEYNAAKSGETYGRPHVSLVLDNDEIHYQADNRLVAKFNVTGTSNPTQILSATTAFTKVEIDNVEMSPIGTGYTFDTIGEHTIKYTLVNDTIIGAQAFQGCRELTSITISNNITKIEQKAFRACGLVSLVIPDSVTSIGDTAFLGCTGLTSIILPNAITKISSNLFNVCRSLTSITIPSGVTRIETSAFAQCSSLSSITSLAATAPTIRSDTFRDVKTKGTLYVPQGSTGYDVWMGTGDYYLGKYNWKKVEDIQSPIVE